MTKPKSCPTPRSNRRPARWGTYQIDHSEPESRAPTLTDWPKTPAFATPVANDDYPPTVRHVSQAELADRLDVSIATLARARKKGLLEGNLVGSQWRFTERQIADYLNRTEKPLRLYGRRLNDNDLLDAS